MFNTTDDTQQKGKSLNVSAMCFYLSNDGSQVTRFTLFFSHKLRHSGQNAYFAREIHYGCLLGSAALFPVNRSRHNKTTTPLQHRGRASGALGFNSVEGSAAAVLPPTATQNVSAVERETVRICLAENIFISVYPASLTTNCCISVGSAGHFLAH